jgi:hypothetical protein
MIKANVAQPAMTVLRHGQSLAKGGICRGSTEDNPRSAHAKTSDTSNRKKKGSSSRQSLDILSNHPLGITPASSNRKFR